MPDIKTIQNYLESERLSFSFMGNHQMMIEGFSPLKAPKEKTITWIKEPSKFDLTSLKDFKELLIVTTFEGKIFIRKWTVLYLLQRPKGSLFYDSDSFLSDKNLHVRHPSHSSG